MTPAPIIATVARAHGFRLRDLIRHDRTRPLAWVRQDAMRRAREAGCSKYAIARTLHRDMRTVTHGIQQSRRRAQETSQC